MRVEVRFGPDTGTARRRKRNRAEGGTVVALIADLSLILRL
jgi:hypothetical protein